MKYFWLIAPFVTIVGLGTYACLVEPYWIEVTRHHIRAPIGDDIRIAQLTDIHTKGIGRRERNMLRILEEEKPDVIVITGDSIHESGNYAAVKTLFRMLRAPHGVWAVKGNWENALPYDGRESEETFYDSTGVRVLDNSSGNIAKGLWLVGIDEFSKGKPDFEKALKGVPPTAFRMALFHSPEYFDQVAGRVDVALTGHTHGGQIRIPFFPPAYCPAGCGEFISGWYEKNGTRMYVSRGIGTSIIDVRFNSRPELTILTIGP
jgi:predicted MPP superfamily phosphohydrolase